MRISHGEQVSRVVFFKFQSRVDLSVCLLGRHPCAGMKVAKLEIKVIVAFFLAGYEYDVVNSEGKFPEQLPKPDYNDIHQVCSVLFFISWHG